MFGSRRSVGSASAPAQPRQGSSNASPENSPEKTEKTGRSSESSSKMQMQVAAMKEQMEQIQLNSIKSQAHLEGKLEAALTQLQQAVDELREAKDQLGGNSLKTSTVVRGVGAALLLLYIQKTMKSKPVSKLTYSKAMRHIHLLMGVGILGGIGTAQAAGRMEPGPEKKQLMELHKGSGFLMLLGIILRIVLRLRSGIPERFPGPRPLQMLETLSHRGFYVLLFMLPTSGLAYTWFAGVSMPILGYSKPEMEDDDTDKAQKALDIHKKLGQFLEYAWVPFHLITLAYHSAKGRSVVKRITPFP